MPGSWYETWFNTPYYEMLYQHRNSGEAVLFIDKLLTLLRLPPQAQILDLACGKGRHTKYLATKGFDVTGVDLSLKSIQHAARYENENLSFFLHDMRNTFRINYFDCIFNFFTSFGYFENDNDDEKAIHAIAAGLKPGGYFALDFFNTDFLTKHLVKEESKTIDEITFTIQKSFNNNFIEKTITVNNKGETKIFHERVKAITKTVFENYLSEYKLHIQYVFGNYELQPFDTATSERLIIIAQK